MRKKNLQARREKEIEEKSSLLKNLETVEDLKLFPLTHHKENLVVMEDCTLSYKGENVKNVLEHFSLKVKSGERIFLQGKNGCGKSSIIKAILMEAGMKEEKDKGLRLTSGKITLPGDLIISYCNQDTSGLHGTLREYAAEQQIDETLFLALLRKLDFSRTQFEKRIEDYSGGQKKKVLLAGSLCKKAHLYIWDEPLNFIDVFSRMQIEELILKFKSAMILVEHDKSFVEHIATSVISIP